MSPYEILGIRSTATLDEAEAAYRARLLEWHPDLHAHAGAEAVAWAEQRTRQLNAAIQAIRAQSRVLAGGGGEPFARDHGFRWAGDDRFGNPHRTRWSVACAMCGLRVYDLAEYRAHLVIDHAFAAQMRKQRQRAVQPPRLTLIPAPMFWALVVLMVYWGCLFATFGDSGIAIAGWWLGILAYLVLLPFAYRAAQYRRRF